MDASSAFDPDALLAAAAAETAGLSDFGPLSFSAGLNALCAAVVDEAQLSDIGVAAVSGLVRQSLARRLQVIDWVKQHPAVGEERVESPVFVVGMFRAGTTLLSYLLDQDPANRSLLSWEAADLTPPSTPQTHRCGPRVEAAMARSGAAAAINPGLAAMHHEDADGPTECVSIMAHHFTSLLWETLANVPSYAAWLTQVDHASTYAYHRQVLQMLQSGGVRGRWMLKSPHHAIAPEAIRQIYPDAVFVMLHRDPVVVAASACSLVGALSGTFTATDHSAYIARRWTDVLEQSIDRVAAFRAAHPDQVFVDLHYADLVRDPMTAVRLIYDATDREVTPSAAEAMTHYVDTHPKGQFGAHRYQLGDLHLDADELSERFAGYIERYAVTREPIP